jgi:hypothetical protein
VGDSYTLWPAITKRVLHVDLLDAITFDAVSIMSLKLEHRIVITTTVALYGHKLIVPSVRHQDRHAMASPQHHREPRQQNTKSGDEIAEISDTLLHNVHNRALGFVPILRVTRV